MSDVVHPADTRRVPARLALVLLAGALTVAASACGGSGSDTTGSSDPGARIAHGLEVTYADRPWTHLVRDVRTTESSAGTSVVVVTAMKATDGVSPQEAQDAAEICRAVVGPLQGTGSRPVPASARVEDDSGTSLATCVRGAAAATTTSGPFTLP